jgi:ribosome biogenesis protein BRX1
VRFLVQIFGVPPGARKAKPFIDHILSFSMLDNKIWFRNFQVCASHGSSRLNTTHTEFKLSIDRRERSPPAQRPSSNDISGDRPPLRPHTNPNIRGRVQRRNGIFKSRCVFIPCPPLHFFFAILSLTVIQSFAEFVSPAASRSAVRREKGEKYKIRKDAEAERMDRREDRRREEDELAVHKVFA